MSETQPTQGDWTVDGFNTTSVIAKQENGSYKHVCRCNYGSNPGEFLDINKANARLIAAAPDLLAALKAAQELLAKTNIFGDKNPVYLQMAEAIGKAQTGRLKNNQ